MAGYVLPTFNITVGFWRNGNPRSNPPNTVSIANLSPGRLVGVDPPEGAGVQIGIGGMWLRLPKGTDAQDWKSGAGPDICECPYTSGRFYECVWVDDIGGGFANEHRFAVLQSFGPWPTPYPPVGGFTPVVPPYTPAFIGSMSSLGLPVVVLNGVGFNAPNRIGGFIAVYGFPNGVPNVQWNGGGVTACQSGPGQFGGPIAAAGITANIYMFSIPHTVGPGTLQITIFPAAALQVMVFQDICNNGSVYSETTGAGLLSFPNMAGYPPIAGHPRIHMAGFARITPGICAWSAPYAADGIPVLDNIALTPIQLDVGCYPSGIGGTFPAAMVGGFDGGFCGFQFAADP